MCVGVCETVFVCVFVCWFFLIFRNITERSDNDINDFFPTSESNQMSVGVLTSQLSVVVLALCGLFVTAVLVMFH